MPVPQNSTVYTLHVQALRRAARLGVTATIDDSLLETIGNNQAVLFGEDLLVDVLDLTEDNTFSLRSFGNPTIPSIATNGGTSNQRSDSGRPLSQPEYSAVPGTDLSSHRTESRIYVRWITLEAAIDNPRL